MTRRELLALGAVLAPDAWPQDTGLQLPAGKDLVVNGNEWINVIATVRNENTNTLVKGLTPADFRIFEDGKEQLIRDFGVDTWRCGTFGGGDVIPAGC